MFVVLLPVKILTNKMDKREHQDKEEKTKQTTEIPPVEECATEQPNIAPENATSNDDKSASELLEALTLAKNEAEEWKDNYIRLSAEFDNYRKRTLREKQELIATASESTLLKILPVVDDFERALQQTSAQDSESLRTGLELIYKLLLRALQECGVSEIKAIDQELNTDYHDAVTQFKVEDESKRGRIVDIIRKGYLLNGRVLRHAQVVVGE